MEELKIISPKAYQYLCDGNPNSWCRAFFRQESKCLNFENGICKSFNRAILVQRTKPIITMLEDIRLYVMQRLVAMNRVARTWEHSITPSIRKRVELLGHNKSSCKKQPVPKPPKVNRPSVQKPPEYGTYASARGRGRGSWGGRGGFGGRGEGTATMGVITVFLEKAGKLTSVDSFCVKRLRFNRVLRELTSVSESLLIHLSVSECLDCHFNAFREVFSCSPKSSRSAYRHDSLFENGFK
ncbi:hypothetical protein Tco_1261687 [Tanacetum coccineum]